MACWPKEKWQLTKWFFVSKNLCFECFNRYIWKCVVDFIACWPKINFHFWINHKITLLIDQKTFNLQLTEGIIDWKFPTFYIPIYPYKTYIFYCYETFLPGNCWKKFPIMYKVLRFHGFLVTKVPNVSCSPVWKFIFIWSMQCQFGFSKFLYIFRPCPHVGNF